MISGEELYDRVTELERENAELRAKLDRLELVARVVAGKNEDDVLCDCGSVEPCHECPLD